MKNRSNRLELHLAKQFALCGLVVSAAVVGSANATIVYSGLLNHVIPANTTGTNMNIETGVLFNGSNSGVTGWDINAFGTSTTAVALFAAVGSGYMRNPGTTASFATRLDAGTVVGSSAFYYGNSSANLGAGIGQWAANSTGYFGFKFIGADALTHYGWMRLSIGANAGTRTIIDFAFETVAGAGIASGAVIPAPGAVALLGLAGFAKRRRRA